MKKIFIDGKNGTTGLRIYERLESRTDIEIITLSEEDRKNPLKRKEALNNSDIAILCLPDDASREAVSFIENENTVVIDTSTAFRADKSFVYGFPELEGNASKIKTSKRIANPGCHASGFVSLIAPLIEKGIIKKDIKLSCFSLTGYSGGGKKMIAEYESNEKSELLYGPRAYGLNQNHKHLKEMKEICGLDFEPVFVPIVDDFYSGMEVMVPLRGDDLSIKKDELVEFYKEYYKNTIIKVSSESENGFLCSVSLKNKDSMEIVVTGNDDRIVLYSRFDNLGKGASGSAIENLNLVMGVDITTSLDL